MRIAIVNPLRGSVSGGYMKYLQLILPRLRGEEKVADVLVLAPENVRQRELWQGLGDVRLTEFRSWCGASRLSPGGEQILDRFQADVAFVPIPRQFRWRNVPTVTMIQNMEPLTFHGKGNHIAEKIMMGFRAIEAKQGAENADRIIALSKFSQDYLVEKWKIPSEKIGQVNFGVDEPSHTRSSERPSIVSDSFPERFYFTAGSIRPARGLEDAIYAMKDLAELGHEDIGLAVAGNPASNMKAYFRRLTAIADKCGLTNRILWAGLLDEQEMGWFYRHCEAFLMTSRVEACSNIVLEAMAHECLCFAGDAPPLPEIFEDAAIFYPSGKHAVLATKLKEALSVSREDRQRMRDKAKKRAAEFTWDRCSRQTINELQIAIRGFVRQS